jgi:hypothetical protein
MQLVPIENLGQVGIIQDTPPYNLPPNAWSAGNNVRLLDNGVKKVAGYQEVFATCPFAPYYIHPYLSSAGTYYWIAYGAADIAVWNGSTWTDVTQQATGTLNATINNSVTTITLTDASAFPASGTIAMGTKAILDGSSNGYEEVTYSGKSTNDLTGCTRSANSTTAAEHTAAYPVVPVGATATGDSDYGANTTTRRWTTTNLNGLIVATNGYDKPQMWPLSGGVPSLGTPFRELQNWPLGTKCKSIRSFRTFLVGLNWERTNEEPRLVKWSTEASYGSPPVTWLESDATLDAGEYELSDTPGDIIDGLPLGDSFLIYKDDSIYIMNYVGTPYIFSFKLLSPTIGLLAKEAVAEFEGGHFFMGNSDFYVCNGQTITPMLSNKLRRTVFDELNGDNYQKCFVAADYVRNEMMACYPAGSSTVANKALIWNWKDNTFSFRDLPDTSYISSGIAEITAGAKWSAWAILNDGSFTASTPANGGSVTVDTTTTPDSGPAFTSTGTLIIDDEQITYTGKTSTTFTGITRGANGTTASAHDDNSMVNQYIETWDSESDPWGATNYDKNAKNIVFADVTNTKIYRDNKGNKKDTVTMDAYIERSGYDLGDPQSVKFVSAVYPQLEVSGDNTVNVYIGRQMSTEDAITWEGPVAFNPNSQSKVSCRVSGKYFGIKIESDTDVDWKLHGLSFEIQKSGLRGVRSYG